MRYISWNCRGLGTKSKEEALEDIIRINKPDILLVQETKMEDSTLHQAAKSFWKKGQGRAISSRGASGGIATFWDTSKYDLINEERSSHWLFTKFNHIESGTQVSLFNLYVPILYSEKKSCWDTLVNFLNMHNPRNIILAGDLNVTLATEEKKGGSLVRDQAREWVEDIILSWDLLDIKPLIGMFTWTNKRLGPGHIAARLDRFLVHSDFLSSGLRASSKILPNCTSDHKPILLDLSLEPNLGPIPFRFSPLWILQCDFQNVVADSWSVPIHGSPSFSWEQKLKRLKKDLKAWAKLLKSPSMARIDSHIALHNHQILMESIPITTAIQNKEMELQKSLFQACRAEEEYWKQKSRSMWLESGDKNTNYFHKQAEARKNLKAVSEIHHQGSLLKDFEDIKAAAFTSFKDLFSAPDDPPLLSSSHPFDLIPTLVHDADNNSLTAPISMKELKSALFRMKPDSAPGPDGFTARFYVSCWDTIKMDLLRMVRHSQVTNRLGGSTNSAFLTLIPKEKGANQFSRFRPISLCNMSYKIVTKIIANRLKKILPRVIPENQGGFIKGRKIQDNILLVQEALHSSIKNKEEGMIIKLDLANAFDRVRHDFLFLIMRKLGFSSSFINWVTGCISMPWIAPLVNGRSTEFFQASRGLRQGCPLSPLLYAIQASVLSFQLNHSQQLGCLPGICMTRNVKNINHAQFADDTLLLGGASIPTARHFKQELEIYKQNSGSKINFQKSKVYGWNCSIRELGEIARVLEMEAVFVWDSFTYLGVPIARGASKANHWISVIDKFKKRIQNWGSNWLNMAGKLVLLKSVLMSIPIYQNSILLAPASVIKKMEGLIRKFLWEGGKGNVHKPHLVSWDKTQKPFKEGGLQLRNLPRQNLAMGAKILWNLVTGKESWSKKVLRKKYFPGQRLRCLDKPTNCKNGSPVFKLCIKVLDDFKGNLYWIPGNGAKINLWEDSIMGDQPIGQLSEIGNLRRWMKENNLNTLWDISTWEDEEDAIWKDWNLSTIPQELKEEKDLLLLHLHGKAPLSRFSKDKRGWGQSKGSYSAAEGYSTFQAVHYAAPNPATWNFIWNYTAVPKIDLFCWKVGHSSILTGENLKRRGLEGPSRCALCNSEEESINHLLLTCPYAKEVWNLVLNQMHIDLPGSTLDLFSSWAGLAPFDLHKKALLKASWMWTPKIICWKIWIERNRRIFQEEFRSSTKVASICKALLGEVIESKHHLNNSIDLNPQELSWLSNFSTKASISSSLKSTTEPWEVRMDEQEFIKWRHKLSESCLFFDGASKGNPGQAGGGGVIFSADNSLRTSFAWGLGHDSNNKAEALALWQGLKLAHENKIIDLTVFGDSRLIVQAMALKKVPPHLHISRILLKISRIADRFRNIRFYHILRNLNNMADAEANKAVLLSRSFIDINGRISSCNIP